MFSEQSFTSATLLTGAKLPCLQRRSCATQPASFMRRGLSPFSGGAPDQVPCLQGIKTAKLPISDHVKLAASSVLTTNQVVDILLKWLETKSWQQALKATVRTRKRAASEAEQSASEKPETKRTKQTKDSSAVLSRNETFGLLPA